MSDRQPTFFPSGHRGEACWEFSLSGPFDKRDVAVPSVLGWKQQRMVLTPGWSNFAPEFLDIW
jgi:hypothetical protein